MVFIFSRFELFLIKLDILIKNSIPKTAFVLFNNGALGGAEKRFTGLFSYLSEKYPGNFYFILNNHLLNHIRRIYHGFPENNIRVVDSINSSREENTAAIESNNSPIIYRDIIPDPMEIDRKTTWLRKIYWFGKNKIRQRNLYKIIEEYRSSLGIEVFVGVFSGILPLVFYLDKTPRRAAVIFSDMDSWFSDVHADMKKLWYRKYYSFNYALEKADHVDFLSPFIVEGVEKRNIVMDKNRYSITACSAADYSKCIIGDKTNIEIAFCSRLEPDKNPLLFLEAAKEILGMHSEIKFHLLGEGSLVNGINNFIDSSNLRDKINFQFHPEPTKIFSRTSIFVSLQTGTNYPSLSVIEAMACGNAVVASNVGDTGLLINETNGVLTELNLASVVSAIKQLINDPEKTAVLGKTGREFVMANHTINKEAEYYIDIIIKTKNKVFGGGN